jgi:hypothetical protein
MTFADLVGGESIFLDANPLVYHFAPPIPRSVRSCMTDAGPVRRCLAARFHLLSCFISALPSVLTSAFCVRYIWYNLVS